MRTTPRRLLVACVLTLVAAGVATSLAQTPAPDSRIDIPLKRWIALEIPVAGKGPSGPMKHVTGAHNPDDGRLYYTGGDYAGREFEQSYRQETWSLSLAERWAQRSDRNAGWRLEYPYCGPAGQVQPKHPDFVGWTWDVKRKVFWMVPGVMEIASGNCPGETPARTSDPGFLLNHLMQFDPATRQWRDVSSKMGAAVETWMSVHDPKTDTLIRFGYTGNGGIVSVYHITDDKWTTRPLGSNRAGKDIRINKEYLAADHAERVIYAIDGVAGRLMRYRMDAQKIEDLGPVPGGPHSHENYMYVVWDSTSKVLLWVRESPPSAHAYQPATKSWEAIPLTADIAEAKVGGRILVYDPLQNVTLLFGGYTENPHMFLFRYGDGK